MRKRFGVFMFFLVSIVLVLFISQLQSCKHDPANISNLPKVCYDPQIKDLIGAKCAECHSGGSREAEGFDATNFKSIKDLVKDGNPWGSKLYTIISSPNNPNMMPPKSRVPLDAKERTLIEVWILQGASDKCDNSVTSGVIQNASQIETPSVGNTN